MTGESIWHHSMAQPLGARRIISCDNPDTIRDGRRHGDDAERAHWRNEPESERNLVAKAAGGLGGIAAMIAQMERIPERYRGGVIHGRGTEMMLLVSLPQLRSLFDRAHATNHPYRVGRVIRADQRRQPRSSLYAVSFPGDERGGGAFTALKLIGRAWDEPDSVEWAESDTNWARHMGLPAPDLVERWSGDVFRLNAHAAGSGRLLSEPARCDHRDGTWRFTPANDAAALSCPTCRRPRVRCVPLHQIPDAERTHGAWALLRRDADIYLTRQAALDRADGQPVCSTIEALVQRDGTASTQTLTTHRAGVPNHLRSAISRR